jgi:hypothetical protein
LCRVQRLTAFSSNSREDAAKLKWDGVRCLFEDAQSDILLLLDTCTIRDAPLAGSHGIKQAIAAWGAESSAKENGSKTFSSILAEALLKLSALKSPFNARLLYEEILARKHADLAQAAPTMNGTLTYSFVEGVKATFPYYVIRLVGGVLYLAGMVIMAYNVFKTVAGAQPVIAPVPQAALAHA